jgi:hypothetical protein
MRLRDHKICPGSPTNTESKQINATKRGGLVEKRGLSFLAVARRNWMKLAQDREETSATGLQDADELG